MSQKSLKERGNFVISNDQNPETINELGFRENIFNKEILTQDHIDNYSIASPDVSKRIEIDIKDLGKPMKVTEYNKQTLEKNNGGGSKKKIDYQEIGQFINNKKQVFEQKPPPTEEDLNFKKIEKSKLFQKFMKEEIGNELNKNPNENNQMNLYENYVKSSKRKKSPAPHNKRQFSDRDGDQELVGYSQIFVPGANNKLSSIYYPQTQKPQINIMDYAAMAPNNENVVFLPNNYYTPTKTFQTAATTRTEEKNDIISIQNKLLETQKALNDEILKKNELENNLKNQQYAQENLSKTLEEFKLKLADQNHFYMEQRNQFEEEHSKLTHKIFHMERNEENIKLEIDDMKRKASQDSMILTNKEEEIKELYRKIEKLNENLREKENILLKKTDELANALKKIDESKNEIYYLKNCVEKLEDKSRSQDNAINSLSNEGDFSVKRMTEMKDKIKDSFSENEKIKLQNSSLSIQLNQIQIDAENYRNEIYQLKQNLLEKQQKEISLVLTLEKATLQNNQLKKILQKTENNIEEQKNLNRNLVDKISEFATTANTSNFNNLKLLNNLYENKHEKPLTNSSDRPERLEKLVKNVPLQIEADRGNNNFKRNEKGYLEPLAIQMTKKSDFNNNKKSDDLEIYYYNDSLNDRDNRFKVNDYINDTAAGSGYHRLESGKKLFNDKYRNNNILSWDANERRENQNSSEKYNSNLNRSYEAQNWSSMPNQMNTKKTLNTNDNNNYNSTKTVNYVEYDENMLENLNDAKEIENILLSLNLQKQEMENDLRKVEDSKIKTGANIKRKNELEISLKTVQSKISKLRLKIRGMNPGHH